MFPRLSLHNSWSEKERMLSAAEFRLGLISVPGNDLDGLPPWCPDCPLLLTKEFSVGDGLYYYYCGFAWQDDPDRSNPPCLAGG